MPPKELKEPNFLTRDMLAFEHGTAFSLVIDIFSEAANEYVIRGFTKEGPFQFSIVTAAGSTTTEQVIGIPDVPILLTVTCSAAAATLGSGYVRVELGINGTRNVTLCEGYPHLFESLAWPTTPIPTELQRRGQIIALTGTNPAANAEISETVPTGNWWKLKSFRAVLVADANAATRRVELRITVGGIVVASIPTIHSHTAGTIVIYMFADNAVAQTDGIGLISSQPIPQDIILPPASVVETVTTNKQAGDDWAAPTLLVERYLTT
ncbi:MAG: hypothetical protein MN733_21695 [Nitrososphaera sp.]|nr:hypothetical protein [Nitrososphaera sp.]